MDLYNYSVIQVQGRAARVAGTMDLYNYTGPGLGLWTYWAIQAGLLTRLTFARYRLSPLAAFTSGAYFLHNGRR